MRFILTVLILVLLPSSLARAQDALPLPDREARDTLQVGQTAPHIKVARWLAPDSTAPDLTGKTVILDFWATWCLPCIRAIPHLDSLARAYRDDGVILVQVSIDDFEADLEAFVQNRAMEGHVGWNGGAYLNYARPPLPQTFLIAPNGTLAWRGDPGQLTPEVLDTFLAKGTAPPPENLLHPLDFALSVSVTTDRTRSRVMIDRDAADPTRRVEVVLWNKTIETAIKQLLSLPGVQFPVEVIGEPPIEPRIDAYVAVSERIDRQEGIAGAADQLARLYGGRVYLREDSPPGWIIDFSGR